MSTRTSSPAYNDTAYKEMVHAFYGGELKEVQQDEWCEERVMHLISHVRSGYGRAFLAVEAGGFVSSVFDAYLNEVPEQSTQLRSFLGFEIFGRNDARRYQRKPQQPLNEAKKKESARRDPSGVGLLSDVCPEAMRFGLTMAEVMKSEIPAPPLESKYRPAWQLDQDQYRLLRAPVLDMIKESRQRIRQTWGIRMFKKAELQEKLLTQQHLLRWLDHTHAENESHFAALMVLGENPNIPLIEEVQMEYAELTQQISKAE